MSRIIVKNLPKKMKDERLRKLFSEKGRITDCSLKYTKNGVFRNFAFIGYRTCEEAQAAVSYFNKTFIDTSKIEVDFAKDLGDVSKPRAWSKYSAENKAQKESNQQPSRKEKTGSEKMKGSKVDKIIGDLKDDQEFKEFLEVHKNRKTKALWNDDVISMEKGAVSSQDKDDQKMDVDPDGADSDTSVSGSDDDDSQDAKEHDAHTPLSDLEYLKSKIVKSNILDSDSDESDADDTDDDDEDSSSGQSDSDSELLIKKPSSSEDTKESEKDKAKRGKKQADASEEPEGIEESGRLYVRNLAYCCEEQDLEELFGKFGPLSEVHLPLDRFTKTIKGFAFITYMMPEHAMKAFSELDGTIFQGRLLHILPGQPKKEQQIEVTDTMSFKKKKELKQKSEASNSRNWNSLFLGANAVADVMAEKYSTSKDQILSAEGKHSLGVRMALGETQVVAETRDFLVENGVVLDAFSKQDSVRSKTVILVKNLPANTQASELNVMFSRYGTLGRIILPPSGVTAIVEYVHPSEARAGFRGLAYTKFHHLPLYLEWAPEGVLSEASTKPEASQAESANAEKDTQKKDMKDESVDLASEEIKEIQKPEAGSCIFVKNVNFDTTEESLAAHFQKYGQIFKATIAKKKDLKNPGKMLSMGYGFVEFVKKKSADKALKHLQHSTLDEHKLELKLSKKDAISKNKTTEENEQNVKKETENSTKILVRNIPFEAKQHEVKELFSVFGEIKFVRLPKKVSGSGSHRGFGFVDFLTKEDAKRAFGALSHSTHLYGRRLVLEWAEKEESIDQLRAKTAENYHNEPAKKKFKKSHLMDELKRTEKT